MLGRVAVRRAVAAADVPAFQALAQMHPGIAGAKAISAPVGAGLYVFNAIEVCALFRHSFRFLTSKYDCYGEFNRMPAVSERRPRHFSLPAYHLVDAEVGALNDQSKCGLDAKSNRSWR